MKQKILPAAILCLSVLLSGCFESQDDRPIQPLSSDSSAARFAAIANEAASNRARLAPAMAAAEANVASGQAAEQQRRIAESQHWVFELPSAALEGVWAMHRDICLAIPKDCEVVQASISNRGAGQGADSGSIEMRVDRSAFASFLKALEKAGAAPIETEITREDKTLQWVDLQARLENALNLRNRLQNMVKDADRTHNLADLLAIERELNRVQSTIDSMESQSRVLAQQTDRVRMNLRYRSAPETVVRDMWDPIRYAWHNMTSTFSRSAGEVMLFVAAAVPWLIVLIPGWLFVRWLLRKLFARWIKRP